MEIVSINGGGRIMTPEQEMKAIVEASGSCWHEYGMELIKVQCHKCFKPAPLFNPDTNDLNALFGYAEKVGFPHVSIWPYEMPETSVRCQISRDGIIFMTTDKDYFVSDANTRADALRSALFQAVQKEVK